MCYKSCKSLCSKCCYFLFFVPLAFLYLSKSAILALLLLPRSLRMPNCTLLPRWSLYVTSMRKNNPFQIRSYATYTCTNYMLLIFTIRPPPPSPPPPPSSSFFTISNTNCRFQTSRPRSLVSTFILKCSHLIHLFLLSDMLLTLCEHTAPLVCSLFEALAARSRNLSIV